MGMLEEAVADFHGGDMMGSAVANYHAADEDSDSLSPKARALYLATNLTPEALAVHANLPNGRSWGDVASHPIEWWDQQVVPGYGQDKKAGQVDLSNKLQARNYLAQQVADSGGYEKSAQDEGLVNNAVSMLGIQGNAQLNDISSAMNRANNVSVGGVNIGGGLVAQGVQNFANGLTSTPQVVARAALNGVHRDGMPSAPALDNMNQAQQATAFQNPYVAGGAQAAGMFFDPAARAAFRMMGFGGIAASPAARAAFATARLEGATLEAAYKAAMPLASFSTPIIASAAEGKFGQAALGVVQSSAKNALAMGGINAAGHLAAGDVKGAVPAFEQGAEQGAIMGPAFEAGGESLALGAQSIANRAVPVGREVADTVGGGEAGGVESQEFQQLYRPQQQQAPQDTQQAAPEPTAAQRNMQNVDFGADDQAARTEAQTHLMDMQAQQNQVDPSPRLDPLHYADPTSQNFENDAHAASNARETEIVDQVHGAKSPNGALYPYKQAYMDALHGGNDVEIHKTEGEFKFAVDQAKLRFGDNLDPFTAKDKTQLQALADRPSAQQVNNPNIAVDSPRGAETGEMLPGQALSPTAGESVLGALRGSDNGISQGNQSERPGVGEADAPQRGNGRVGGQPSDQGGQPAAQRPTGEGFRGPQVVSRPQAQATPPVVTGEPLMDRALHEFTQQHASAPDADRINQTANSRPDQIVPGSPVANPGNHSAPVAPQGKAAKIVQAVKSFLSSPLQSTRDALVRDVRERGNFIGSHAGLGSPDVQNALTKVWTAPRFGDNQAAQIYKDAFAGLPDYVPRTTIDLAQNWRRQIMVEDAAEDVADKLVGNAVGYKQQVEKVINDAVAKAEPTGQAPSSSSLKSTPAQVAAEIEHNLRQIHQTLGDRWDTLNKSEGTADMLAQTGGNLPKYDAQDEADRMAMPGVQDAIKRLNQNYAPMIEDLRVDAGLGLNSRAGTKPLFLNLPTEVTAPQPKSTEAGVVVQRRFASTATGEGEYVKNPEEYFRRVYTGHIKSAAEARLASAVNASHIAFDPDSPQIRTVSPALAGSKKPDFFEADINGKKTPMQVVDLSHENEPPNLKYVPKSLADELNKVYQDNDPGQRNAYTAANSAITGLAITGTDIGAHSRRLLGNVASKVAAAGESPMSYIPGVGSQVQAIQTARRLVGTPYGEALQQMNEQLGADANRGYQLGSSGDMHGGEKFLYNRANGVDPALRRVALDSVLKMKMGIDTMRQMEADVNSGKLDPAQMVRKLNRTLSDVDQIDLARQINGTAGFLNTQTRGNTINRLRTFMPFVGSESGTIPHELQDFLTLGIDPASIKNMTTPAQAMDLIGKQIASGPLGKYLMMNAVNWATTKAFTGTGKFMWQNDKGHKMDVQIAPGWHLSNMFPELARPARETAVKDMLNSGDIGDLKSASREGINEYLAMQAPLSKLLFSAATSREEGGRRISSVPNLQPDFTMRKVPTAAAMLSTVPGRNTAAEVFQERGNATDKAKAAGRGFVKDVAGAAGFTLSDDNGSPRQARMQDTGDAARTLTGAIKSTPQGSDARINAFDQAKQTSEDKGLDFREVRTLGNSGARKDDYSAIKSIIDSDLKANRTKLGERSQAEFNKIYGSLKESGAKPIDVYNALVKSGFHPDEIREYFEEAP